MMKSFSVRDRALNIEKMQHESFDLLIIGGGINGAGVARDAASRGMKVALIEAHDFAFGTSSRSSKLIHGGIRYLENYEFKLVFEALSERAKLFEIAPHLVHPLRFVLPVYEDSRVGMNLMSAGMWLYDILALFRVPEIHERLNSTESLQRLPMLRRKGLKGSFVYSDAYMDDDRLVIETLRSANELGAIAANYISATGAKFHENGHIASVDCEDKLGGKKFSIKAKHVISTVGPWTDEVASRLLKDWKKILRPSKGIHLTLPKGRLQLHDAVVMAAEKEDRIVFGIPRHEMIIVGTTDTDYRGSLEEVVATPEDVRYLLNIVDEYFPGAKIKPSDILASYAGVRPLVQDQSGSVGKTSREHTIIRDPRGVTFVAGGKYTTYRLVSQETVEAALHDFGIEDRVKFNRNNTYVPLNPAASPDNFERAQLMPDIWAKESHFSVDDLSFLVQRHGMEVEQFLNEFAYNSDSVWQIEVLHAVHNTMCLHLVDFYTRRVHLFLAEKDHGIEILDYLADCFQQELGWTDQQKQQEKHALHVHIKSELSWMSQVK